jgi:ribosome modulation factor
MGDLGYRVAHRAHKEGRAAFKAGKSERENPYDGRAARDSDEWLRHHGWKNGWMFAYFLAGQREARAKRGLK